MLSHICLFLRRSMRISTLSIIWQKLIHLFDYDIKSSKYVGINFELILNFI